MRDGRQRSFPNVEIADRYRSIAIQASGLAFLAADDDERGMYLGWAEQWRRLADMAAGS